MTNLKVCLFCQKEFRALNARRVTCGKQLCTNKNKNKTRAHGRYLSRQDKHTDRQEYLDNKEMRKRLEYADISDEKFKMVIGAKRF